MAHDRLPPPLPGMHSDDVPAAERNPRWGGVVFAPLNCVRTHNSWHLSLRRRKNRRKTRLKELKKIGVAGEKGAVVVGTVEINFCTLLPRRQRGGGDGTSVANYFICSSTWVTMDTFRCDLRLSIVGKGAFQLARTR